MCCVGSYDFIFQHEGKKGRALLRKADDVNWKVCRQPCLSMRSEKVFSPNTSHIWILPPDCFGNGLVLNSEGVHFGSVFDLTRDNHRLKDSLPGAVLILPAWGWELEVAVARDRSYQESWAAAEESGVTFQEQFSCLMDMLKKKQKVRSGCCEKLTAPSVANCARRMVWYRSWDEARTSGQSLTALLCHLLHSSERWWSSFSIWTELILPIKLPLVLKIQRNKPIYFYVTSFPNLPREQKLNELFWELFSSFSCSFGKVNDLMICAS